MMDEYVSTESSASWMSTVVPAIKTTSCERPPGFCDHISPDTSPYFFVNLTCLERPPAICDHFWLALGVVLNSRYYCIIILYYNYIRNKTENNHKVGWKTL